jgi:hypothetical protein
LGGERREGRWSSVTEHLLLGWAQQHSRHARNKPAGLKLKMKMSFYYAQILHQLPYPVMALLPGLWKKRPISISFRGVYLASPMDISVGRHVFVRTWFI